MNRKWTSAFGMMALALVVFMVGCAPKEPPEMPEPPVVDETPDAPVEDVSPAPQPTVEEDMTPEWMSADMVELNANLVKSGLLGDVYFDFDRYELRPDALERLQKNAKFMKDYPTFVFGLEGHCDERGTNEYNLALGERRANAAKSYLESLGIPASRIRTISYGEERPFCTQHDEACWAKNRRGHFVVTGKAG